MSTATTDASATIKKAPPAGYTVHREASAEVLLAEGRDVFINPIQEFNRDLSTLAIHTWSEIFDDEKRQAWERKQQNNNAKKNKKRKFQEDDNQVQIEKNAVTDLAAEPEVIQRISTFHFT
jgi:tRNA (guanine26-N2/guanine27-N2)-dimethyltransferase